VFGKPGKMQKKKAELGLSMRGGTFKRRVRRSSSYHENGQESKRDTARHDS